MKNISQVILWSNGMILTFDKDGQQMPQFNGMRSNVVKKFKKYDWKNYIDKIQFKICVWPSNLGAEAPFNHLFSEGWN